MGQQQILVLWITLNMPTDEQQAGTSRTTFLDGFCPLRKNHVLLEPGGTE